MTLILILFADKMVNLPKCRHNKMQRKILKTAVWDANIGLLKGRHRCMRCNVYMMTQMYFGLGKRDPLRDEVVENLRAECLLCSNLPGPDARTEKQLTIWDRHIGLDVGKAPCYVCGLHDITQLNFDQGHVQAKGKKGPDTVENLRPQCSNCNGSIKTDNLIEYILKHRLTKGLLWKEVHSSPYFFGRQEAVENARWLKKWKLVRASLRA